jgi:signal transduction histidine kinase
MRVELSKALSILSHEVRGSLGVLQGYLRMLREGVSDPALSSRMLESMQEATTRLAAVAREASELSAWTEGRRSEGREDRRIGQVLEDVAATAGVTDVTVVVPDEFSGALVRSDPPGALARALAAVLVASRRESQTAAFRLAVGPGSAADEIVLEMGPAAAGAAVTVPPEAAFDFGRGGMGLSLVLASHVLEAHGARLTTAGDDRSRVTVRLQRDGGSL